jgi:hypothetical protein
MERRQSVSSLQCKITYARYAKYSAPYKRHREKKPTNLGKRIPFSPETK